MGKPLNPKQLKFVERYLATGNATQSYIDAYGDMDRKSAEAGASRLLSNVKVKEAIAQATGKAVQTAELTAEYVIKGLKKEAEREGDGAQHSARIKAYELLGKIIKLIDADEKPKDKGDDKGLPVEHVTKLLATLLANRPVTGSAGGSGGAAVAGNPVGAEPRTPGPSLPE